MITCILEGMQKNTHIHINYDKVREITQGADENPGLFLARLTEAPPQKHAQPVANGDTGRWTVPRDALAPLERSPLLPRTPAQPYESCSNDGAQVGAH